MQPTLSQCMEFAPKLSSRRMSAWRACGFDGDAAARAIGQPEDEPEESGSESGDDGDDAAQQAQQRVQHDATVRALTLILTLTLTLTLTPVSYTHLRAHET